MTQYVISTMSNSVAYCFYGNLDNPHVVPTIKKKVVIQGGANLPSLRSGFGEMGRNEEGQPMWTPSGVVTPISDADAEALMTNHVFKSHLESGLVKIIAKDITGNHKEVAKQTGTMLARDDFAQMTPAALKQKIKVSTAKDSDDAYRI